MITVINPGLLTSIQDLGRQGFRKFGIITSGVMDPLAHRIANLLVGNMEHQPTLELTLIGPILKFEKDALISICGGGLTPLIDGAPVPLWRSLLIKKGSQLSFTQSKTGYRAYLAIAGGFAIPMVMGSTSTYLRAGIGGFDGRSLKRGDQLQCQPLSLLSKKMFQTIEKKSVNHSYCKLNWSVTSEFNSLFRNDRSIRVMEGRHFHLFSKESKERFFKERYEINANSDRMGYRLKGFPLVLEEPKEMITEAVNFGTIQVPADGNPIILLADCQTTGGYPVIGQIITVDLPLVAQTKPGKSLIFKKLSHAEAQLLYIRREQQIKRLKQGIMLKFH